MNLKYKDLSIVGKIWSIAEVLNAGIAHNNKKWIVSAVDKFEQIYNDEEMYNFHILNEDTLTKILQQVIEIKLTYLDGYKFVDSLQVDDSIICLVWQSRFQLDGIKQNIKHNQVKNEDVELLDIVLSKISKVYFEDLKQKKLQGKERRDLFKIREEIIDVKIAMDKKIKHNHIEVL